MGSGVEVGAGGRGVNVEDGISDGSIVGEAGAIVAVTGSEVPHAAAPKASRTNRNLNLIINLILAHMIPLPNQMEPAILEVHSYDTVLGDVGRAYARPTSPKTEFFQPFRELLILRIAVT